VKKNPFSLNLYLIGFIFLLAGCSKSSSPAPVLLPLKPAIASISPNSGPANASVTITGADFDPTASSNTVKFNGVAATVTSASSTSLVVTAPAGGSTGAVTVSTAGGMATGPVFTYQAAVVPPTIGSISPLTGPANTLFTISGTNFKTVLTDNTVKFNGVVAAIQTATATVLTVLAPATGTTGAVTVTTADGTATGSVFTYTISAVSVYLSGWGINGYGYWKDGVFNSLPNCVSTRSIFVSGTDIYVAGADNTGGPAYWKNGTLNSLPMSPTHNGGEAQAVIVSGSDVYVAGFDLINGALSKPKCWKNGVALPDPTLSSGDTLGGLYGVSVSGTDVYVAGFEGPYSGNEIATYWKNGTPVTLTDGSSVAIGTGCYNSGSDIYVSGYIEGITQAYYWKNGTPLPMNTPVITGTTFGRSVYVSSTGDVYVSGDYKGLAKYWKNGTMVDLTSTVPANGVSETGFTITGNGNDIYIGGVYSGQGSGFWKNGVYTAVSGASFITGIFVK
jgi:IPT/TIG domain